jgi:hypothetical protein
MLLIPLDSLKLNYVQSYYASSTINKIIHPSENILVALIL